MANKRTFLRLVAVLGCAVIALAGCGNRGDSGPKAPTAEEVAAAEYTMLAATQAMFTWYPTVDASPADAYQRAAPALRGDMRPGFNSITDGAAALWPRWRKDKLTLTAAAQFAPGSQATNSPGQIERSVVVIQTVIFPDGKVDTSREFKIDRVVASYGNDGWKVDAINFFPQNQFFIPACPPGNTHTPAPDGPCKPIPAPPATKTCPDGTSVPAGAVCPAQRNQPQTKKCPDGSTVAASAQCATHGPRTKQCPDGSTVLDTDECGTTQTQTCPEGQTRGADGVCAATPPEACPNGQTRGADGRCTAPTVTCPDGSTAPSTAECPKVQEVVLCPDGSSAPSQAQCPKAPEPCPISGQFRGADGVCTCGAGRATYPEGCGDYIGAPAPGIEVVTPPRRQPVSFRRPLRRRRCRGLQCCHAGRPSAAHRRRC